MPFNPAQNPFLNDFQGGQMTDLPSYVVSNPPDLTALMEIVSPGSASAGVNYAVSLAQLALLIGQGALATLVPQGTIYDSVTSDVRILIDGGTNAPTTINLLAATSYFQPLLIKDINGTAATYPITINFAGTYDGGASPNVIDTNYGWFWMNPLASGNWYDSG